MKLQLALDMLSTEEAIRIADLTHAHVDILQIGTPLLKHEGHRVIKELRRHFPYHELLVDLKSIDVGYYEANFCFDAGADIVTVLEVAHNNTIKGATECAHKHGKKVLVDCIRVLNLPERVRELAQIGIDYLGVHSGIDEQQDGKSPLADFLLLKQATTLPIAVAGGLNLSTINVVVAGEPAIVVVGYAITGAVHPGEMAREIRSRMS